MELLRMLSGNSRLKERAREAEQVNEVFKENLDNVEGVLKSDKSTNVYALLDMIYESSFPEEQIFMKTPTRARLKSKKELLVRLLIGLDALGVPTMAEMLTFVRKHGSEGISESLVTLLELLSPFLEGKQAPEFTTDDVMDAMDFEWHSTSRTGSPLLNVIASATSSPRASAASLGDSPLNPIVSGSPFRRAVSDRSMFLSRSHELGAKSVLDKTATSASPHHPNLTAAASSKEILSEIEALPEITLPPINEKPPSYSLDTLPTSSEHGSQRRHRRQSSSLRQLFAEDTIDEVSWEGSVGASSKRNSSSSSWRRNSSEFPKVLTNVTGSGFSSPINPSLATGGGALDEEVLSSIQTHDWNINGSSRKGSHRVSPSLPYNEVALWREDIDGFTVDLVSSNKNPAQASVSSAPIPEKCSGEIHEIERHIDETEKLIDGSVEAAPLSGDIDAPKAKKGTVEQDGILPIEPSSLSNTIPDDSPCIISYDLQADVSSSRSCISRSGEGFCESDEPSVEAADHCHTEKEDLDHAIYAERGDSAKHNSAQDPFQAEGFSRMLQDHNEELEDCNHGQDAYEDYGDGSLEDVILVCANGNPVATQEVCSEDECNKGEDARGEEECNIGEDVRGDSISDNDRDLNVEYVDAYGASPNDNTDSSSGSDGLESSSANNSTAGKSSHWNSCAEEIPIENDGASQKSLQIEQSHNVLQHGHHRSQSDITPLRSLFKVESLVQEQKLTNGSRSDCDVETDILRRRFAKRLRSLTASMESLMVREGSPGRVVMQECMPWMDVSESSHSKEESEEQIVKGSVSESEFSTSEESTSSSSPSADDAGCKSPYEPLILRELEAEVHSSGVDCAGQAHESEAGAQCERDEDFEEHARRAHSLDINHEEDGENATYLLDITHGEEPGHSYSLDDHEEGAIHAHVLDNHHEQHERENASDEINPEGSLQEGIDIDCVTSSASCDRECVAEVDVSELSDDLHQYNHIEIEGNTKGIHNCDIPGIDRSSMKISPELRSDDDNKGNVHMQVDDVSVPCDMDEASLENHEHQQFDNLCSPLSLFKKVDIRAANLHGKPHVGPQNQTEPATVHDLTWDVDTKEPRSKRGTSGAGRLAGGCLSCCRKPRTNP